MGKTEDFWRPEFGPKKAAGRCVVEVGRGQTDKEWLTFIRVKDIVRLLLRIKLH